MDIDIKQCVGNATDGAANMQGHYRGFSALLTGESPKPSTHMVFRTRYINK
jgi:hypothetical protein